MGRNEQIDDKGSLPTNGNSSSPTSCSFSSYSTAASAPAWGFFISLSTSLKAVKSNIPIAMAHVAGWVAVAQLGGEASVLRCAVLCWVGFWFGSVWFGLVLLFSIDMATLPGAFSSRCLSCSAMFCCCFSCSPSPLLSHSLSRSPSAFTNGGMCLPDRVTDSAHSACPSASARACA